MAFLTGKGLPAFAAAGSLPYGRRMMDGRFPEMQRMGGLDG
jgi:hypothetical protein